MTRRDDTDPLTPGDRLWYKDAIIYEVHVRAFFDSDGDGVGDFAGLTQKLDYLKDLGVTAIWLLPFYPSPLLDDGYDIADYTDVHPSYGTLREVRTFIREAHRRGLRVITELVCNHTSDQHAWFQRARRAPRSSPQRDFYVWSDSPDRYKGARIIFKDFESSNWTWDPVAGAYYWHRFYRHQPDLNFDNPRVREAIMRVMDFWLEMGVDGLRLDAIPYLYEREGTSCENLPETFEFLRELRAHIDANFQDRMLLAEANQWPEDAVNYFGRGDLCHMAFHFPLMPRLFMSIHMEDRFPIVDIVRQTPPIPETCQWAVFLRNHDELTLEMVTDEERDYMYRVYAVDQSMRINLGIRRRLAPLLGNHRRRIELMNGLLFSLPGTPVIYYGDEIGMGDNVYLGDRNGVRMPMQWSADRNAGFSKANPQRLYLPVIIDPEYHYETVNVEAQTENPHSLLWWTRRLIALRKRYKAFGRGTMEFLNPENRKVLAFIRRYEDERILVVVNLSRFVQGVTLDLSEFKGMGMVEMFGRVEMPGVIEGPYFLTLGPHSFYWFSIEPVRVPTPRPAWLSEAGEPPVRALATNWRNLMRPDGSDLLNQDLAGFLATRRWFAGKGRTVRSAVIEEVVPVRYETRTFYLCFVAVEYAEGAGETYVLPLGFESGEAAFHRQQNTPEAVFLRLKSAENGEDGILFDASYSEAFGQALLRFVERGIRQRTANGELVGSRTPAFRRIGRPSEVRVSVLKADQSNTSINFSDRFLLKLFRKVESGTNPDYEIGRYLTERGFAHAPRVAGAIEYVRARREPITLAVLHEFIAKESDAWQLTMDSLR
ncbi:MAG TPA: maltose alpha-D-glucosyltransferase, partial [Dehalococcoidia bacterium]|nr:maltose alpha-D-glucosyltransferase [Dehalococcoidia bacterium]